MKKFQLKSMNSQDAGKILKTSFSKYGSEPTERDDVEENIEQRTALILVTPDRVQQKCASIRFG